jgi:c-di-GMP-binding flagellar brake protein YcgR
MKILKRDRAHIRFDLQQEIRYATDSQREANLRAITLNISDGGLCMYIFTSLNRGQKIVIERGLGDAYKTGEIRWIIQLGDNVYKAGLMFTP